MNEYFTCLDRDCRVALILHNTVISIGAIQPNIRGLGADPSTRNNALDRRFPTGLNDNVNERRG